MNHPFSIREALRFGWHQVWAHSGLLFKIVILMLVLGFLRVVLSAGGSAVSQILGALISLVLIALGIGITIISLKLARGESTSLRDIIPPWSLAWRYLLSSLIVGIFMAVCVAIPVALGVLAVSTLSGIEGKVLFGLAVALGVIAGCYVMLRYAMVKYVAIDGTQDIGTILRKSKVLSRGAMWHLRLFVVVLILLNILGAFLLFIGLLITIPIPLLAMAYVYLRLCEQVELHHSLSPVSETMVA